MERKIRILQFSLAQSKGGRTRYILENWNYIDRSRFYFDFVTFDQHLDFEEELCVTGYITHHFSCYPSEDRERFLREWNQILDFGYDIVHLHIGYWADTILEDEAKKRNGLKLVIHALNTGIARSMARKEREAAIQRHHTIREGLRADFADAYWACSKPAAEWLFGNQIPEERVKVMKNAIHIDKFSFSESKRKKCREEFGLGDDFVVGTVGRLSREKNTLFLVKAFEIALRQRQNMRLLIIGDGECRDELEQYIQFHGLSHKIRLLGMREDADELLQALDFFCLPSLFEGFPLAFIEAQAAGLPCLCSEKISDEVIVAPSAKMLSLKPDVWAEALIAGQVSTTREKGADILKKAGFDLKDQIKRIEQEYVFLSENRSL